MRKFTPTLVVLCTFFMFSTRIVAQDIEPNDVYSQASIFTPTSTTYGNTDAVDLIDWYYTEVPLTGTWDVVLIPGTSDLQLSIYAADGITLMQTTNLNADGGTEAISNAGLSVGMYYVKIETISGTGAYTIQSMFTPQGSALNAQIMASPMQGAAPLIVNFNGSATGQISIWEWDFTNDGIPDDNYQNTSYTYTTPGIYTVKLLVEDINATTEIVYKTIEVTVPPVYNFVLDDFEDSDTINNLLCSWVTYNDNLAGGLSTIAASFVPGDVSVSAISFDYLLDMGTLTYDAYVGLQSNLSPNGGILDISSSTGISFNYKGAPSKIRIHTQNITDYSFYEVSIPETTVWTSYTFTWDMFAQQAWGSPQPLDLSLATGVSFNAQGPSGTGTVSIDDIVLKDFHYIPVDSISSYWTTWEMSKLSSHSMDVYTYPSNASNSALVFSTSDPTIVTIDQYGNFFMQNIGTATVTATCVSNPALSFTQNIIVTPIPLNADFSSDYRNGFTPLAVQYYDYSTGEISTWDWDLNGDGISDSNVQSPSYIYETPGSYAVRLITTDIYGTRDTAFKQNYIHVELSGQILVDFNTSYESGQAPHNTYFYDNSYGGTIVSWAWDFNGDMIIDATEQNPSFTYTLPGIYSVTLTVTDDLANSYSYTKNAFVSVQPAPIYASFSINQSSGYPPLNVLFSDMSYGGIITQWEWDLDNDGIIDSNEQNPTFSYTTPGYHTVVLTVRDDYGQFNTFTNTNCIYVYQSEPVQAYIGVNQSGGYAPFAVQFYDYSSGTVVSRAWDFDGDMITDATEQNPSFTYTNPGSYQATLTITDAMSNVSSTFVNIDVWEDTRDKYCEMETQAVLGSNYLDFASATTNTNGQLVKWYTYTASTDTRVKIDICGADYSGWAEVFNIYSGCEYLYNYQNIKLLSCGSGKMSAMVTVTAGETIYFSIVSDGPVDGKTGFNFQVSEVPIQPGDICTLPLTAQLGSNSANTVNGEQWFEYVAANDGYIEISSCGTTTLNTSFEVYRNDCSNLFMSSDNDCGLQSKSFFHVAMGDIILISWKDFYVKEQFNWNITYYGQNDLYADFSAYPTMGVDTALINFNAMAINAEIVEWDFNNDGITDSDMLNPTWAFMEPGFYTIKMMARHVDGIQTQNVIKTDYIFVQKSQNGNYCETASPSSIGTNQMSFVNGSQQWFKYTADFEGKLEINLCNSNYTEYAQVYDVFKGCSGENIYAQQYGCGNKSSKQVPVMPGDEIYFQIFTNGYVLGIKELTFELNKILPQPGDLCRLPITLSNNGIYTIQPNNPNLGVNKTVWYEYTAPRDGVLEINSCINQDPGGYLSFNINSNCDNTSGSYLNYNYKSCSSSSTYGAIISVELLANQKVLIQANAAVYQQAQWQLNFRDYYYGEICTKPLVAKVGVNTIPAGMNEVNYTFTPTANGLVSVSNCQYSSAILEMGYSPVIVKKGCLDSSEIISYAAGNCGSSSQTAFEVVAGETYNIQWYAQSGSNWDLEFIENATLPAGYTCENPYIIETDQKTVDPTGNIVWFEFTIDQAGTYALTSDMRNDAAIFILDSCVAISENMTSSAPFVMTDTALVFWPEAGKTYKMLIIFKEEAPQIPYTIYKKYISNQTMPSHVVCSDAEFIATTGPKQTTTKVNNYWYQYNAKANTILHVSYDNNVFEELGVDIKLYYGCPSPFEGDDYSYDNYYSYCGTGSLNGKSRMIQNDTTIYISVTSRDSSVVVDWSLFEYSTSAAGVLSMSSQNDVEPAIIDNVNNTVTLTVSQSSDTNYVNLNFNLFVGSRMNDMPYNYTICPGTQMYFNNGQKTVVITSADGTVSEEWTIFVNKATFLNDATDIISLQSNYFKNVIIDPVANVADVELAWYTPSCFNQYVQLSGGARLVDNIDNVCVDVSPTINTDVVAEDNYEIATWEINYSKEEVPQGIVCADPITARLGYNNVRFDQTQSQAWYRYTVQNDGILEINGCDLSWGSSIAVMSSCTTPLQAEYMSCGSESFMNQAQLHVLENQVVYIAVNRQDTSYYSNSELNISEIPDIVTYLSVTPQDVSVLLNDTVTLSMIIYPSQTLMQNVTASISTGVITPLAINRYKATQVGDAVITFTTTDGSNKTQTVTVHVLPLPILVSNIVIPTALNLIPSETVNIPTIITPSNANNIGVYWESENPNIAYVDQYGMIKAQTVGTTIIRAYSVDGSNIISNACTITVSPVAAENVIVNKTSVVIPLGGIYTDIIATVLPINATNKNVVWTSNNPSVVSIVNNQLYGFSVGVTTIKIALADNSTIFATVSVSVTNSVILDKSILSYKIQQAENIIATITAQAMIGTNAGQYPQSAVTALQTVIASSKTIESNAVAQSEIDDAIEILQTAMIDFEAARIGKVEIVFLNIKRDTIYSFTNETKQITPEIYPSNATFIELDWVSDDNSIASVNSSGLITAYAAGETYIRAYAKDGSGKMDSVKVFVLNPLLSIYIPQSISVLEGGSIKLEPIKYPYDAEIDGYVWMSDDDSVATVDEYGNVRGVVEGIATISVIETKSGKAATSLVYVESQSVDVTGIQIQRDSIILVLGESAVIYPYVLPYNATNQAYSWSVSNSKVIVNSSGIVTAFDIGEAIVTATTVDGGFTDIVKIIIVPSAAPTVAEIEEVQIETGTAQVELDLSNYVTDDNTALQDLQIDIVNNPNFTVTVIGNVLVIEPTDPSVPIVDSIDVVITDQDNLVSTVSIPVVISPVPNEAPEFVVTEPEFKALDGTNFPIIDLTNLVNDDYTINSELIYEIATPSTNFMTFISNGVLEVSRIDGNWIGIDSVEVIVTDGAGLTVSKYIMLEVSQLPNQAPIISTIATQNYIQSTGKYPLIDLKRYVTDDYTLASDIDWTYTPNAKLQISISRGIVTVLPADRNWTGSTTVTFTAFDQDGLSSSINVVYIQTTTSSSSWVALPKIAFSASQTVVGPGAPVTFTSSMSGADSWIWEFEGLSLTPQQRIVPNPTVTYTKGGKYTVKLFAGNSHGDDSVVKVDYITVIGIDEVNPILCKGSTETLVATVPATAGYTFDWSTDETTESITIAPTATTTYVLTVKKGWFTYEDQVTITVPDTLVLPADTAICSGDSYMITAPNFFQYNWNNTGWVPTNSLAVNQVGTTRLLVRDNNGCESSDSIAITELYELPQVSLGADQNVCEGSNTTLLPTVTGGVSPYSYSWSTSVSSPSILVTNDGEFGVEVTDANGCVNVDTAIVTILRPFAEPLGVATFAQEGNGVVLAWERSLEKRTESYEVQRETSVAGVFEVIATVPFDTDQSFVIDDDANVLTKQFTYKLVTIDSTCHNRAESPIHSTVHVIPDVSDITHHATLEWSKYVGLPIATYKIMKGTSLTNLDEVDAVAGTASPSWVDPDLYQYGTIYRIEMVLPDTVETRWPLLKAESGPFTLALSNIAEAETSIDAAVESNVLIYPTIATTVVNVELGEIIENVTVQLISASGNIVYNKTISGKTVQISVADFAAGVYTVKVISGTNEITSNIIIE